MPLAHDESDTVTSDSESDSSQNSPENSAAGSGSPPSLMEDIAAFDLGFRHTCRGRKITTWPPLSRRVARNHEANRECPTGCKFDGDECLLELKLRNKAKERERNCEACSNGLEK